MTKGVAVKSHEAWTSKLFCSEYLLPVIVVRASVKKKLGLEVNVLSSESFLPSTSISESSSKKEMWVCSGAINPCVLIGPNKPDATAAVSTAILNANWNRLKPFSSDFFIT